MKRANYILCLLFAVFSSFYGVSQQYIIIGKVQNAQTRAPLHRANVKIKASSLGTSTNKEGNFKLRLRNKSQFTLQISYIGFESNSIVFSARKLKELNNDTIKLNILLKPTATNFNPIDIVSKREPEKVFGSFQYHVSDYEILDNDRYLILLYEKKLKKGARLIITDFQHKVLSEFQLPGGAKELFKDYDGNTNLITKNKVYRVKEKENLINLADIPKDDFERLIKPCIDTVDSKILFSDYQWYYPEFNYYTYDKEDSTKKEVIYITDKKLREIYRSEYKYLTPKQKLEARKIEWKTGMDKIDAAALFISKFQNSFYHEELYAPAFIINDTIMVFDHYNDLLYKFTPESKMIDSVAIDYHKSKQLKWKKKLIKDDVNDEVFSLYYKNGNYFLRKVNTQSGQTKANFKLAYRYIENIKIKDGYVYYIYRPFESLQKKYLYREVINQE